MSPQGVLTFRHPWILGKDKRGVPVRRSYTKLSHAKRGRIMDEVTELLKAATRQRKDTPTKVGEQLKDAYFGVPGAAGQSVSNMDIFVDRNGDGSAVVQVVPVNSPLKKGWVALRATLWLNDAPRRESLSRG